MMQNLQESVAASRVEQEQIQMDLVASQSMNEKLRRELCSQAENRKAGERECFTPPREFPMPFSQEIMDVAIPATFVGPKVVFTSSEDPEAHLNCVSHADDASRWY